MPAAAGQAGCARANAARHVALVLWLLATEDLPHLEQRGILEAAIGVGARGRKQAGQQARPHVSHFARNGIGQAKFGRAAAEEPRLRFRHERPGYGFDEAAGGKCAACAKHALLAGRQHRFRNACLARQRRAWNALRTRKAHHLLDEVGGAVDIGPPGGRRHT